MKKDTTNGLISQKQLKDYLEYREDGHLYRLVRTSNRINVGDRFGNYTPYGYIVGRVFGVSVFEHRLVFLYHTGYLPSEVDHINGVRDDNRIENLRGVSRAQNQYNRKPNKRCKSVYKGVDYKNGKWRARIGGEHLGYFSDEIEAAKAYDNAANKIFGQYARINGE